MRRIAVIKPEVPSTENSTNSVNQTENSTEKSEGISALSNANLVGTVIDFTETGCTLGKGSVTEDTMTAPATGEDTEGVEKISVQYADNTQFQISNSTSTNVTLEAGTKRRCKKNHQQSFCMGNIRKMEHSWLRV